MKIEIVLGDDMVGKAVETIRRAAQTGRLGDGKISVSKIEWEQTRCQRRLAMHGCIWRAGSLAVAIALSAPPLGASGTSRTVEFAQDVPVPDHAADEPSQAVANAVSVSRANSPGQIRKAQIELRRLDCFQGIADGKLGYQTRQAVKKFWASAMQPATEVNITDELIADLSERGDNFCRPPRRFFGFGPRPGGNPAALPFIPRGTQPPPLPATPECLALPPRRSSR